MEERTTIEIAGVKMEVDLRHARRIEEIRIGDRVKVLHKEPYQSETVISPGIVIGFEPFKELPTIVVAYVKENFSSAEVKFLYLNAKTKDAEMVAAADPDFAVDRDAILARFDRQIAEHQAKIDGIAEQRRYFQTNFRAFWERVAMPESVA